MNNFNATPQNKSEQPNQVNSGWDTLTESTSYVPFEAAGESKEGHKNQAARKADIINGALQRYEVKDPDNISGEAIDEAFAIINDFQNREQNRSNLIASMANAPAKTNPEQTLRSVAGNKHQSRILAHMSGKGFDNYQNSTYDDLESFLQEFPTPVEFEAASNSFIKGIIMGKNSPAKVNEYIQDMENFKHNVYGEQQDYFEAMEELSKTADARARARGNAESAVRRDEEIRQRLEYQREHAQEINDQMRAHHWNNPYASPEARGVIPEPTEPAKPKKQGLFGKFFKRKN